MMNGVTNGERVERMIILRTPCRIGVKRKRGHTLMGCLFILLRSQSTMCSGVKFQVNTALMDSTPIIESTSFLGMNCQVAQLFGVLSVLKQQMNIPQNAS